MSQILFSNNAKSTLAGAISNVATTANLAVGTGSLFPNPTGSDYFLMTFTDAATGLINEIVRVTARSGDVVTIVRAQEGTSALPWAAGDLASNRLTAGTMGAMQQASNSITKLSANMSVYVSTTGSDVTGDGSNGSPFATITYAYKFIAFGYDLNGFTATIRVKSGTYSENIVTGASVTGATGPGGVVITSDSGTASDVTLNSTANAPVLSTVYNSTIRLQNLTITSSGGVGGNGIYASRGGQIIHSGVVFGACTGSHIVSEFGGIIQETGTKSITGGAINHYSVLQGGMIQNQDQAATLTGTPAFSGAFAANVGGQLQTLALSSFTGGATGVRYSATLNGVINTGGAGSTFFPGSSAGSVATGGVYA